jgi:hypothetical protein
MNNDSHEEGYPSFMDLVTLIASAKFRLGSIAITSNAYELIHPLDAFDAMKRHSQGDWGDVAEEDKGLNDIALEDGSRLLSVYKDRHGETFWLITEADRSVTTILMPEDY